MSKADSDPCGFGHIFDAELEDVANRRRYYGGSTAQSPRQDLAGLALSGGGIRSATFCLGLLQALDDRNLLPAFDYLSTVSGGGYIGGWWSAWLSRPSRGSRRRDGIISFPLACQPVPPLPEGVSYLCKSGPRLWTRVSLSEADVVYLLSLSTHPIYQKAVRD